MAYSDMIQELLGIPGTNLGLVKVKINEAFMAIQNENVWSFQLITNGWLTPSLLGPGSPNTGYGDGGYGDGGYGGDGGTSGVNNTPFLSPGTITVTPFTTTIVGDAVATAVWIKRILSPPFITQYQFRVPYYSLYSIVSFGWASTVAFIQVQSSGFDQTPGMYTVNGTGGSGMGAKALITVNADGFVLDPPIVLVQGIGYTNPDGTPNPPTFNLAAGGTPATFTVTLNAALTTDRPWMEPAQFNSSYMAYQAYYPAPPGFKRWYNIRDTTNNNYMDWWSKTQIDLSDQDAERTDFDEPLYVVPFQQDTRPGSATYGQMLYELWPHPITELPYTFACQANWKPLVNPSDTVPYPLTEELVKLRAYEMITIWKEQQRGDEMERGSGSNNQFLVGVYRAEYTNRLKQCRNMDRNLVDLYFSKMQRIPSSGEPYATVGGQLNVGF